MRIGLKYCGGCNPNYERSSIAKRAQTDYPHIQFEPYDPAHHYDAVLVICGCLAECFTFTCANSDHGIVPIRSPQEYHRLVDLINSHTQIVQAPPSSCAPPDCGQSERS